MINAPSMLENEYNIRQLRMMLDSIAEYESGRSSLGKLVSNLEALQSALEGQSSSFQESFESIWGQLEDTHAMMLYEERASPNEIDREILTDSIAKLQALIASYIT